MSKMLDFPVELTTLFVQKIQKILWHYSIIFAIIMFAATYYALTVNTSADSRYFTFYIDLSYIMIYGGTSWFLAAFRLFSYFCQFF